MQPVKFRRPFLHIRRHTIKHDASILICSSILSGIIVAVRTAAKHIQRSVLGALQRTARPVGRRDRRVQPRVEVGVNPDETRGVVVPPPARQAVDGMFIAARLDAYLVLSDVGEGIDADRLPQGLLGVIAGGDVQRPVGPLSWPPLEPVYVVMLAAKRPWMGACYYALFLRFVTKLPVPGVRKLDFEHRAAILGHFAQFL